MESNLIELLELALRVPEIGAVNFNILYTVLKAIILAQGLDEIVPDGLFFDYFRKTGSSDEAGKREGVFKRRIDADQTINGFNNAINVNKEKLRRLEDALESQKKIIECDLIKAIEVDSINEKLSSELNTMQSLAEKFKNFEKDFDAAKELFEKEVNKVLHLENYVSRLIEQVERLEELLKVISSLYSDSEDKKKMKEYQTILLFEILDEHDQKLKEEFIIYIKNQIDPLMNELYMLESDVKGLSGKVGNLKYRIEGAGDQPMDARLEALEAAKKQHEQLMKDLHQQLSKKAEIDDLSDKAETEQLKRVENKLLALCETASSNITILEDMIKESVSLLRDDIRTRLLISEFEVHLKQLENKIRSLERRGKEQKSKSPAKHFPNVRPIEIKQYVPGAEGMKPIWLPSSPESLKSSLSDDNCPARVQLKVQRMLEDASVRHSKLLIEGAHTKIDIRRRMHF